MANWPLSGSQPEKKVLVIDARERVLRPALGRNADNTPSQWRRAAAHRPKRYPLNTVLAIAVAARLAGYRGVNEFAALLSQEQLEAVGAFWSPSKQRYTAPAITTFHNILAALPPETLDNAIGQWTGQHSTSHGLRHGREGPARRLEADRRRARMMVAAVEHDSGMVGRWRSTARATPAVRELSSGVDHALATSIRSTLYSMRPGRIGIQCHKFQDRWWAPQVSFVHETQRIGGPATPIPHRRSTQHNRFSTPDRRVGSRIGQCRAAGGSVRRQRLPVGPGSSGTNLFHLNRRRLEPGRRELHDAARP